MLLTYNSELEIKVSENCMSTFNIDYNACAYYYIGATVANWVIVASTGGSALVGGIYAQLGIELALMICQDTAAQHYLDCFNDSVIL